MDRQTFLNSGLTRAYKELQDFSKSVTPYTTDEQDDKLRSIMEVVRTLRNEMARG